MKTAAMAVLRLVILTAFLLPISVHSLASTDSIAAADPPQSGYLPNHNMDPSIVDSSQFGQLWKNPYPGEQVSNGARIGDLTEHATDLWLRLLYDIVLCAATRIYARIWNADRLPGID